MSGTLLWIVLATAVLIGAAVLFAAEIGLDMVWHEVWSRIGKRGKKEPRFPWSDRTGT